MLQWLWCNFMLMVAFESVSMQVLIAVSVKPCIIIVHNISFKHALWPCALYIHFLLQWLLRILFQLWHKSLFICSYESCEFQTLHCNCLSTHYDPVPLIYILHSNDFVIIYVNRSFCPLCTLTACSLQPSDCPMQVWHVLPQNFYFF